MTILGMLTYSRHVKGLRIIDDEGAPCAIGGIESIAIAYYSNLLVSLAKLCCFFDLLDEGR